MFFLVGVQGAVNFALMMSQLEGGCPVDYNTITDLFLQVSVGWLMSLKAVDFILLVLGDTKELYYGFNDWVCILQRNMIREATAFLLDVLKPNLPEHALLQTKVTSSLFIYCNYDQSG